jgi:tellurite resistance protein TehA-like permease
VYLNDLTISYCLLGAGLFPALFVQALYLQRLAIHKLPPATIAVSVFLPLGPCGQSAFTLLQLARVGRMLEANTGHGVLISGPEGQMMTTAISALSYMGSMALVGLGSWWLIHALLTIGHTARQEGFAFNM